ncbi:MAG: cell division protein ZapA [Clostridiales bacterium]|nr:cell division protein ZapA [Clostridiales bacterium]MBQ3107891.1 cell division protein ZapA [Bacillota bacterium]
MEERNRVTVKIGGQEYTIAGTAARDHIITVADYVDSKMQELSAALVNRSKTDIAVLSAVNAADEYFTLLRDTDSLRDRNAQLEKDTAHYIQLWEEAKKSFIQYKEESQAVVSLKDELQREVMEKEQTINELRRRIMTMEEEMDAMQRKHTNLMQRMEAQEEAKSSSAGELKALEEKCREMENNYFDLQMENIRLKGEVERYKKIVE